MFYNIFTLLYRNLLIAVAILGSLCYELDPVLDLCDPGINSMAGALAAVANHPNLGESKYILLISCISYSEYSQFTFHSQPT